MLRPSEQPEILEGIDSSWDKEAAARGWDGRNVYWEKDMGGGREETLGKGQQIPPQKGVTGGKNKEHAYKE